jgi:excisionase family DNA binding protein
VKRTNAASSNPTALERCSEAGAPYPSGSLKIAEMETQTQAASAKGGDQKRLAYSVQEAADLLGVHYFSVYRLVQRKKLRACRVLSGKLLIPRSELERLLKT